MSMVLIATGVALMALGAFVMLSGVGVIGARPDGGKPRIEPARVALGALIDAAGVAALLFALMS